MEFIDDDYLLESETAASLYDAIEDRPILDPHSHVDPPTAETWLQAHSVCWNQAYFNTTRCSGLSTRASKSRGVTERSFRGQPCPDCCEEKEQPKCGEAVYPQEFVEGESLTF